GRARLALQDICEAPFERGPEIGLPHQEDRKYFVLIQRRNPFRCGFSRSILRRETAMRVDGDINGIILTQAPCCPRHTEMARDKRLDVRLLCAEVTGVT